MTEICPQNPKITQISGGSYPQNGSNNKITFLEMWALVKYGKIPILLPIHGQMTEIYTQNPKRPIILGAAAPKRFQQQSYFFGNVSICKSPPNTDFGTYP